MFKVALKKTVLAYSSVETQSKKIFKTDLIQILHLTGDGGQDKYLWNEATVSPSTILLLGTHDSVCYSRLSQKSKDTQ